MDEEVVTEEVSIESLYTAKDVLGDALTTLYDMPDYSDAYTHFALEHYTEHIREMFNLINTALDSVQRRGEVSKARLELY